MLIVDDSAAIRKALVAAFLSNGFKTCAQAENGKEGIELAQQIHPDRRKNEAGYWAVRDQLLDKYNGQVEYALAAYNAGSDRVEEWRGENYRDIVEFVENIPFTETREYVQAIQRNVGVYRRLYGTP